MYSYAVKRSAESFEDVGSNRKKMQKSNTQEARPSVLFDHFFKTSIVTKKRLQNYPIQMQQRVALLEKSGQMGPVFVSNIDKAGNPIPLCRPLMWYPLKKYGLPVKTRPEE